MHGRLMAAVALLPLAAPAQVHVIPASPREQETVFVQVAESVIGLTPSPVRGFDIYFPEATRVTMVANRIVVSVELMDSQIPERVPSREMNQPLGQLPAGEYQLEVVRRLPDGTPAGTVGSTTFSVRARAASEPAWNNTDLWWNPQESGWGLNLIQHGSGIIFATWFVYGEDGRATWYVVPEGRWVRPFEYRGPIYRTTGPALQGTFNPAAVTRTLVGSAILAFDGSNANSLLAEFTIDGRTTIKQLQRQGF